MLDVFQFRRHLLVKGFGVSTEAFLQEDTMYALVRHGLADGAVKEFADCNGTYSILLEKVAKNHFDYSVAVGNGYFDARGLPHFPHCKSNADEDGNSEGGPSLKLDWGEKIGDSFNYSENDAETRKDVL